MTSPIITESKRWRIPLSLCVGLAVVPFAWSQTTTDEDDLDDENVYTLSPFEVDASGNVGYYTANTLAGSRLNTKMSDLASSITVVNLEQMEDTASTDLNDIMRYEANTEGAGTYTESVQSLRNDGVVDTNAGYTHGGDHLTQSVNTANRIRGIGRPGATINYYPALANVPFDSYNTGSVEIARGPNSLLFGMGNPAGIVNQSYAWASFGSDFTKIKLRTDEQGSFRANLSFNRELAEDKFAVYGSFLVDNREFTRKPSYDDTERLHLAATFKPTEKTTIKASVELYSNDHSRPNTLTPVDMVSEWRDGGRWGFNPATGIATNAAGESTGPFVWSTSSPRIDDTRAWIESQPGFSAALWNSAKTQYNGVNIYSWGVFSNPNSIMFTPGMILDNNSRPKYHMYDGDVAMYNYFRADRYRLGYGTADNPSGNAPYAIETADIYANPIADAAYNTAFTSTDLISADGNGIGSYQYPGVTDKSIYDWTKYNTLAMNYGSKNNTTYNVELEQKITDELTFSAGVFQQDYDEIANYTVSQLNATKLRVDTNTHNPDGSVNPYFGLPVIMGPTDPDRFVNEVRNRTMRAMLAWTPDFTKNDGWTRWLGRHQFVGLVSNYNTLGSFWRKRWYIEDSDEGINNAVFLTKNPNNRADGTPTGYNLANRSTQRLWYLGRVGDTQNGTVTKGATPWNQASYEGNMSYFNWGSNSWDSQRYQSAYLDHSAHTARSERDVQSMSVGGTGFFWNDRIITTLGWRRDDYRARDTTNGVLYEQDLDSNGDLVVKEAAMTSVEQYVNGYYQTEEVFKRWQRWDEVSGETTTYGAVVRPFDNWKRIDSPFLKSLGFSYNRSDNFNPPSGAQVDVFGNELGKPTGVGEDWGIQFALADNKLFARINWFKATNENERASPGTTISRMTGNVDTTLFRNWARTIVLINHGYDPTNQESWALVDELTEAENEALEPEIAAIWGQDFDYYDNLPGSVYGTRSAEAEGVEVQITYNPLPNWTMKLTGGSQETKYSNVLKEYFAWYDHRSPVWDGARGADYLNDDSFVSYTMWNGREVNLADFWGSYGYNSNILSDDPNNPNAQAYYQNIVDPQVAIQTDLEGQAAPGQRKWRWSFISNYTFVEGKMEGLNVGGSVRWEDKSVIGYYGRTNPATDSTDLTLSDVDRPIYDDANTRVDLWVGYKFKLPFAKDVDARVRLNVVDVFEDGHLQVVRVNYDASPSAYRIVDPRQFILSMDFDF